MILGIIILAIAIIFFVLVFVDSAKFDNFIIGLIFTLSCIIGFTLILNAQTKDERKVVRNVTHVSIDTNYVITTNERSDTIYNILL